MACEQKTRPTKADATVFGVYCDGSCDLMFDQNDNPVNPTCGFITPMKIVGGDHFEPDGDGDCGCYVDGPPPTVKKGPPQKVDTTKNDAWFTALQYFNKPSKPAPVVGRKNITGTGKRK
jgi:hypothetical protein